MGTFPVAPELTLMVQCASSSSSSPSPSRQHFKKMSEGDSKRLITMMARKGGRGWFAMKGPSPLSSALLRRGDNEESCERVHESVRRTDGASARTIRRAESGKQAAWHKGGEAFGPVSRHVSMSHLFISPKAPRTKWLSIPNWFESFPAFGQSASPSS